MIYSVVQSSPHIPPCLSTRYPPLIHPISPLSDPHNKNVPSLLSGNGTNNQSVQQALSALRLPRGAFSSSMAHRCLYGRWRFCSRFIPRKRMQNRIIGRSSDLSSRPFPASFLGCQWFGRANHSLCQCLARHITEWDLQQRVCYGLSPYSLFNQRVAADTCYSQYVKRFRHMRCFLMPLRTMRAASFPEPTAKVQKIVDMCKYILFLPLVGFGIVHLFSRFAKRFAADSCLSITLFIRKDNIYLHMS